MSELCRPKLFFLHFSSLEAAVTPPAVRPFLYLRGGLDRLPPIGIPHRNEARKAGTPGGVPLSGPMASKKFKGRTCVCCATAQSTTGDHVIAREFFPEEHRANLPKVPACRLCNQARATPEHYLTAVLPFGGRTASAPQQLTVDVPPRLARNFGLSRDLATGARRDGNECLRVRNAPHGIEGLCCGRTVAASLPLARR